MMKYRSPQFFQRKGFNQVNRPFFLPTLGIRQWQILYPSLMLGIFFIMPLSIMLAVSIAHRSTSGFYQLGFDLSHYQQVLTPLFIRQSLFSFSLAGIVSLSCVSIAFPFTYLLTQLSRSTQVYILILLLAVLSLSEVVISFSWAVLLSRTAGFSNILVWLGWLSKPIAWSPGFSAVLIALVYRTLPFSVLVFYPSIARLNPEIAEAAQTLGASPLRLFFDVIVPLQRQAITTGLILVFVFTLGAYSIPQMLGQPPQWTISVLITDQAVQQSNLPLAAALSFILMAVSLVLVWLTIAILLRKSAPIVKETSSS